MKDRTSQLDRTGILIPLAVFSATEYWVNAENARFTQQDGSCAETPTDILDTRRALELEINSIGLLMSSVSARLNALAPVNRLPPETFAHIFHFLRDSDADRPLPTYDPQAPPTASLPPRVVGWVPAATHVCRQWRTAALEHPALWSNIRSELGAEWKREFLRRSKMALVVIQPNRMGLPSRKEVITGELAADIAHHLPHIRELSIDGAVDILAPIVQALDRPAPILEKLALSNLNVPPPSMGHVQMPVFPLEAFSGSAPRLRDLTLQRWSFLWSSIAFASLAHLTVSHPIYDRPHDAGDFGQLLVTLQKMPALEKLTLEHILPPLPTGVTHHSVCGPTIPFPKLCSIRLADEIRKCGLALKHMTIPATAEWHVSCMQHHQGCDFLLPWLATRINNSPLIRTLALTEIYDWPTIAAYDRDVTNFANPKLAVNSPHSDSELPIFQLTLGHNGGQLPFPQIRMLLNAMPLGDLRVLSVSSEQGWSTQDWSTLFGMCNDLRHARIRFSCARPLCELLLTGFSPVQGGEAPIYPRLEELTLLNVRFGHGRHLRNDELPERLMGQGILKKLVIKECSISSELVERLREVVSEVVWDGHLRDMSDDLDEEGD
ncbi:hypothetical protein EVG20_g3349 [Dentipellis fragilis]|uniref:F-box domain-containing protein n=1 Tax=Dentipellis fragilis TaxID=205917 RepID=A0A4Y9Z4H1_9AGAM|nr:hypothetical protein EVG20_g3349 [Dentipellis fragilis]